MNASTIFKKILNKDDARSFKVVKNIIGSLAVKGISILANIALIPLTIDYLSDVKYGIWLTISSTLSMINFFDIGLGHGLRNKLTEAITKGEMHKAKSYVSTAYISITIMCAVLFGIFMIINYFLDWNAFLNIPNNVDEKMSDIATIVFSMFAVQFIFQLINSILLSTQQSYKVGLFSMISNVLALLGIFILKFYVKESLYYIAFIFSAIPVLTYAVLNIYYFKTSFKDFSPSIKFFRRDALKDVLNIGLKFFVIQIAVMVLITTSNVLICRYMDPSFVPPYAIAFRYFSIITMVFSIMMVPYWSAYTEAYIKKDYAWIRKTIKQALRLWGAVAVGAVVMLAVSGFVYPILSHNDPKVLSKIDLTLSLLMMLYVVLISFGSVFLMFLNGIGQIKLQMTINIIGMCLFFPLTYLFVRVLGMGLPGIMLSTIIGGFYGYAIAPFEVRSVLQKHKDEEAMNKPL
ncbi:MAG TPA: MATE family efflux transporter, partial [Bacteroidia bacterium]|nr:MATE family efflux transporter [Bacteroidia bacterium]